MTHLEVENLASDYLEGQLDGGRQAAFEAHLEGCGPCRELLAGVRHALELCREAERLEPRPWLIHKILLATVGEPKPGWGERLGQFFRPVLQPRVAYPIAMSVFTFSMLVNAAGLNLRHLRLEDLDPRTWVERVNRQGHLVYARAEKFCYDLRVVYDMESRWKQLRRQPQVQQEERPSTPAGGSSLQAVPDPTMAERAPEGGFRSEGGRSQMP